MKARTISKKTKEKIDKMSKKELAEYIWKHARRGSYGFRYAIKKFIKK